MIHVGRERYRTDQQRRSVQESHHPSCRTGLCPHGNPDARNKSEQWPSAGRCLPQAIPVSADACAATESDCPAYRGSATVPDFDHLLHTEYLRRTLDHGE